MSWAGIFVNRESAIPLHRQVASAIREAILHGKLVDGERLLSSRELQGLLRVSRNTIVDALAQLHEEGYVLTVRGVGTFVAQPIERLSRKDDGEFVAPAELTPNALAYIESDRMLNEPLAALPFRPGIPALDLFPSAQFRRCIRSDDWNSELLNYPDDRGYQPLREAIAQRLRQTRGVTCGADQILITAGAQGALSLIAAVLLREGDTAIVEDPGYPNIHAILQAQKARTMPVPVDDDGIDPQAFPGGSAALVHVTPAHQYPSCAVLSLERRFALLEWAQKHKAWIVEDDYDSEFSYTGHPQPALHALSEGRGVVYVGTFSKILSPALRTGFIVVPPELRSAFESAQRVMGGAQNTFVQCALARFILDGHLARHIVRMRRVYDERRQFASECLTKMGGGAIRVRDTRAGLHFVAELPDDIDDAAASRRARRAGVIVPPLSQYFSSNRRQRGFLIGFAATPRSVARDAIRTVIQAITTAEKTNERAYL